MTPRRWAKCESLLRSYVLSCQDSTEDVDAIRWYETFRNCRQLDEELVMPRPWSETHKEEMVEIRKILDEFEILEILSPDLDMLEGAISILELFAVSDMEVLV